MYREKETANVAVFFLFPNTASVIYGNEQKEEEEEKKKKKKRERGRRKERAAEDGAK